MTQENLRANPRCGSTSPSTGRRCKKLDIHNRTEETVTHQNGPLTWTADTARCRSVSPETDRRCKLPVGHGLTADSIVTGYIVHKNGPCSWGVGLRTGANRMEEISPEVTSGGWPTSTDPTISADADSIIGSLTDGLRTAYGNPNIRVTGPTSLTFTKAPSPESDQQPQYAEDRFGEPEPTEEEQLAQWWRDKSEAEIKQTVAKAVEYGATDLIDIGRSIARIAGREYDEETGGLIEDDEAAEMGIFFYLEGKLSRWRSALERGDRPSVDTLLDIGVYARMAQRIRSHGSWPGTDKPQLREGGPVFPSAFPNGIKINQVMWAGRDITERLGRNPDGTLNVSAEAVDRAVRADNEKRAAEEAGLATDPDPSDCNCNACKED